MIKKMMATIIILAWIAGLILPFWHVHPFEIWMLNVGQGESVLMKNKNHFILFDAGPDESVLPEVGKIIPPWQKTIDTLIISHNHIDHFGGAIPLLERYRIKQLWTSGSISKSAAFLTFQQKILAQNPQIIIACQTCAYPSQIADLDIQVIHPIQNCQNQTPKNEHDTNLSMKITYDQFSLLLTGDLEIKHLKDIVQNCQLPQCNLKSHILQVPHHGSKTGLNQEILQKIQPEIALIPVGLGNKLGHPTPEILDLLQKHQITIYRTDLNKTIHIYYNQNQINIKPDT